MDTTRWTSRLSDDGCAIFLFHGVVERNDYLVRNYTGKHLSKDDFASTLAALKADGAPISLDELVDHVENGTPLPPRAFAITFDDGFLNNLTVAAPVLADFHIPATFYVTSGFIAGNVMSWIDRIEWAVEKTLPKGGGSLALPWGQSGFTDPASARVMLSEIRRRVKSDPAVDPHAIADVAQEQLGLPITVASADPLDQKMAWKEVADLAAGPGFIVGGHSHSHAILSFLAPDDLEFEIATSLAMLRDEAGVTTKHYSYPEGLAHCYSDQVIQSLQRHGIVCSPSAEDGVNHDPMDLFRLKRIFVVPE